nr:hypothetical protein [Candidatus Cloacimonadota bacterium]
MRILHIDAERGWRGGQQQAFYLHEGLCKAGIHSDFVCQKGSMLQQRLKEEDLPYKAIHFLAEIDIIGSKRLANYAKHENINILHAHSSHALSWALGAKIFYPSVKVVASRRVDFHIRKNLLSHRKYMSPRLDAIVAISRHIYDVLLADGIPQSKLHLIHSGIDLQRFTNSQAQKNFRSIWGIPEESLIVGTIAAFVGHKDYPNFIQAAALARQQNPNLHFIAVGSGPKLEQMEQLARDLRLSPGFTFTGNQTEVGSLLKVFDIFVLASQKEGLGTSVLDAMSVGLPVIGTTAGGIPEMIVNLQSGILVPKSNPLALSETILRLAADRDLRARLGKAALERVKLFSKEEMLHKNMDLYQNLL